MRTYSRPPYWRGLEPSRPGSLMMITRAPVCCSVRRLGLTYRLYACTSRRLTRRSGYSVVSRRLTLPQEENISGRGSDAVLCLVIFIQSVDLGCLDGVPIRRSIPASRILTCSGLFGGEGCKKNDGTDACSPSRFP